LHTGRVVVPSEVVGSGEVPVGIVAAPARNQPPRGFSRRAGRPASAGFVDSSTTARDDRELLTKNVHNDFVKPGDSGSKRSIFFELLHLALTIRGTHDKGIIVDLVGLPIKTPERPAQFCSGIVDLRVILILAIVETEFHP